MRLSPSAMRHKVGPEFNSILTFYNTNCGFYKSTRHTRPLAFSTIPCNRHRPHPTPTPLVTNKSPRSHLTSRFLPSLTCTNNQGTGLQGPYLAPSLMHSSRMQRCQRSNMQLIVIGHPNPTVTPRQDRPPSVLMLLCSILLLPVQMIRPLRTVGCLLLADVYPLIYLTARYVESVRQSW